MFLFPEIEHALVRACELFCSVFNIITMNGLEMSVLLTQI
uniref:Uncharacterized protein n=1 Tax=Rhizophora mucronata TaxID=61149 RepID=A0A2P2Q572_RHIMU